MGKWASVAELFDEMGPVALERWGVKAMWDVASWEQDGTV